MIPELLTVTEVAKRLRCKPDLVRAMIRSGKLEAFDITKGNRASYRITEAAVSAFLSASEVEPVESDESIKKQFKPRIKKLKYMQA